MADLADVIQIILAQQQAKERKEARDQDMQLKMIGMEIEASKSMYNENMKLYYDAQASLDKLEASYGESVGSLDALGELYTASGKDVTVDVYKGKATNYQARADNALSNIQAIKNKIGVLQDVLYTDVKRVQNVMAGGFGFEGGDDEEAWDIGDLGLVTYEAKFGKASDTVVQMFKNNPGVMMKSLANLQKTEQALDLNKSKMEFYKEKETVTKEKYEQSKANLFFGTLLNNSAQKSNKLQFDGLLSLEANEEDQDRIKEYEDSRMEILANTAEEFSALLGRELDDIGKFELANEYHEMHDLSKGTKTSYGDMSLFNTYVQEANESYKKALNDGNAEKAKLLNELAIKYFGMPAGVELSKFAKDVAEQYSKTVLSEFTGSNDVIEDDQKSIEDQEKHEWENLLDD